MKLKDVLKKIMDKKRVSKSEKGKYNDYVFNVGNEILKARLAKGWTQLNLAKKMKTKQPSIARAESGSKLPSLSFMYKLSQVLRVELTIPRFVQKIESNTSPTFNTKMPADIKPRIVQITPAFYLARYSGDTLSN